MSKQLWHTVGLSHAFGMCTMSMLHILQLQSAHWCAGNGFKRTYCSEASAKVKHAGGAQQVDAATLAKAHKLSVPVGVLAGVFGSFVGVGGGVLIVPMLTGACKALPQRLLTALPIFIIALHTQLVFVLAGLTTPTSFPACKGMHTNIHLLKSIPWYNISAYMFAS